MVCIWLLGFFYYFYHAFLYIPTGSHSQGSFQCLSNIPYGAREVKLILL